MRAPTQRAPPHPSRPQSKDGQGSLRLLLALLLVPITLFLLPSSATQVSYLIAAAARHTERPPCGRLTPFTLSKPAHSFAGPNYREATRVTVGPFRSRRFAAGSSLKFTVYRATGREFVVAPHAALQDPAIRRCVAHLSHRALAPLRADVSLLLSGPQRPEPLWTEDALPGELRLPHARDFSPFGGALAKLYLDETHSVGTSTSSHTAASIQTNSAQQPAANPEDGLTDYAGAAFAAAPQPNEQRPWRPAMEGSSLLGWVSVAERLHGGGTHLCWGGGLGCGGFACGLHRRVHTINAHPRCNEEALAYSAPPQQRRCGAPAASCIAGGTSDGYSRNRSAAGRAEFFARYAAAGGLTSAAAALDGKLPPYYDTVLLDGRYRPAAAVRALARLRRDCLLLVDDWRLVARPAYARLLRYYEMLGRCGGLAVFAARENVTAASVEEWSRYQQAG